jgi:uncharacterized membrane protein HdeD (DUF308 family)|uniref:DUF3040 domain-containing protein n=1 Tax=Candidatus Planktophila sp. TaxID=2175601 RepID=UPI004049DF89
MALSDREQRLLAEMEEALSADDPRLVSTLSGKSSKFSASIGIAIVAVISGFAILFAGLIAQLTLIGVGGFVVALVGVILLINGVTKSAAKFGKTGRSPKRARRSFTDGFTKGMEDRWDQRNNG